MRMKKTSFKYTFKINIMTDTIFKVNRTFIEYLLNNGFHFASENEHRYYYNPTKNLQVRIDVKKNEFALIDSKGFRILDDFEISQKELDSYIK